MSRPRLPPLATFFARVTAPPEDREQILGDLEEGFRARVRSGGVHVARRWYRHQAAMSVLPNLQQRHRKWRRQWRRRRGDPFMHRLITDLRYALRGMRRNWAFSLVVAFTLSVGIGANTLVYSVVDRLVLNPFPFPDPARLVGIGSEWPRLSRDLEFWETLSPPEYQDVKTQTRTMEHVVMWDMGFRTVSFGIQPPEVTFAAFWFDDAFPTMGMPPTLGRGFAPDELEQGARVAIVSHRFWRTRMAEDPNAAGETIYIEGEPYTLIGVMPDRAQLYGTDLWLPMGASPDRFRRNGRSMQILARIRDGFTLEDVNTELAAISGRIAEEYGAEFDEYPGWRMRALTWTDVNVRQLKPAALALSGAVGFVLLIVCADVASLLLARSASRRREMAVRRALGAGRGRIVGQLLTESVVLASVGGAVGIGFAVAILPVINARLGSLPFVSVEVSLNYRVMVFTAGVSVMAGILFGLAPAWHAATDTLRGTLHAEGGASTGGRRRSRLQRFFVGAECALALALLAQAGLLANSFIRLQRVDPAFDTARTLTMRLTLPGVRYAPEQITPFFQELIERVEGLAGVERAGAGSQFPPVTFARGQFAIEGEQYATDDELPTAFLTQVTDGYLETLGIPLLQGRTFGPQDTPSTPLVTVINEAAARRFFGAENPIGRRFQVGRDRSEGRWAEIVGVVRSVRNRGPETEPQPEIYAHIRQLESPSNQLYLLVRTETDPHPLLPTIQTAVQSIDPNQPVYAVRTIDEAFAQQIGPRQVGAFALSALALFALILAAAGIYAVVSYGVGERTREIGLRIALGAPERSVRQLVVRDAMAPVVVGGVFGIAMALVAGRAMASLLFEVSGTDPLTVTAMALTLAACAAAASYFPARRAAKLDPVVALNRAP